MADPIRTDEFPTYDTYPGPESARTARPGLDFVPTTREQGTDAQGAGRDSRLQEAAEQIGSTIGRAVRSLQQLPETMEQARNEIRDRVEQARVDARDRLTVIRGGDGDASGKVAEVKQAAQDKLRAARDRAMAMTRNARARAQQVADEQPLMVVLGVFIGAVALGAALRIWRSHE